jgi:hypothetical protein
MRATENTSTATVKRTSFNGFAAKSSSLIRIQIKKKWFELEIELKWFNNNR